MLDHDLTPHPAAELFPHLTGDAFSELVKDVRENGLLEPVVVHEGQVLDGRNRLRACEEAGVQPQFVEWDGECDTPARYVVAKNIHRRHLTASQRAMIATELLDMEKEKAAERQAQAEGEHRGKKKAEVSSGNDSRTDEDQGRARDKAGEAVGVSGRLVSDAEKVKKKDPERAEKVKEGARTVQEMLREMDTEPLVSGFPKDERDRSLAFLSQAAIPPQTREDVAEKLRAKPQEERLRIYTLHENGEPKQRKLARSEALDLPPSPDPLHTKLGGWAISLRRYADRMGETARLKLLMAADAIDEALEIEETTNA